MAERTRTRLAERLFMVAVLAAAFVLLAFAVAVVVHVVVR